MRAEHTLLTEQLLRHAQRLSWNGVNWFRNQESNAIHRAAHPAKHQRHRFIRVSPRVWAEPNKGSRSEP